MKSIATIHKKNNNYEAYFLKDILEISTDEITESNNLILKHNTIPVTKSKLLISQTN